MAIYSTITIFLAATSACVSYVLVRRRADAQANACARELAEAKVALATAEATFDVRERELRNYLDDARQREKEAKAETTSAGERYGRLAEELRTAVEEKGRFQSEANRVEELRIALVDRDSRIDSLNIRIIDLEREKAEAQKDVEAAKTRATEMIALEQETQSEIINAKNEQITKLNEFITQARDVLKTEFKALSADALNDASAQLIRAADGLIEKHGEKARVDVKLHQQHIQTILKPVEESIRKLDQHVGESNLARTKAEAVLDDQVRRLAGASESLTSALRKPVVRGSWGEMTLENALENAGLQREIDFVLQHETDGEDGRKRTDAIINLPKGRKLIVDSKNLMESYLALANAQDETQRASLAEVHSRSLRGHIKALSAKEYWKRYEGLDCVILFIPHDGMYHAAIQDEAEAIREACEKRVFVSNPMSLIPLLKAIRYVLDQEKLNKSAEEISRVGTELYTELARFAKSIANIGNKLKLTVSAYNEAIPGVDRFIIAKSRALKQLGSGKGADAERPEAVDQEPKLFSSRELRACNAPPEENDALQGAA
jgi:DNA recombination protein RmuC